MAPFANLLHVAREAVAESRDPDTLPRVTACIQECLQVDEGGWSMLYVLLIADAQFKFVAKFREKLLRNYTRGFPLGDLKDHLDKTLVEEFLLTSTRRATWLDGSPWPQTTLAF